MPFGTYDGMPNFMGLIGRNGSELHCNWSENITSFNLVRFDFKASLLTSSTQQEHEKVTA